jgi:hypothetical protein
VEHALAADRPKSVTGCADLAADTATKRLETSWGCHAAATDDELRSGA